MNSTEEVCAGNTLFCRRRNKWNSSYQSEENNNPRLDLSSPVNDRGNYAHIVRQANRITVRFSLWLGCHPPIIVVPPDWSSPSLSQSLSSPFHCLSCFIFSFVSLHFSSSLRLVLQANESKAGGNSLTPVRPPARSGPYFPAPQCLHTLVSPGNTAVHHSSSGSPANTFTTFKLATVTANHASASHVSRCCGLLFSKAAAVNLSSPEWEGRREWPGGRPQLTSFHLLAQAASSFFIWWVLEEHVSYTKTWLGVSDRKMYALRIKPVTQHWHVVGGCCSSVDGLWFYVVLHMVGRYMLKYSNRPSAARQLAIADVFAQSRQVCGCGEAPTFPGSAGQCVRVPYIYYIIQTQRKQTQQTSHG